MERVIPFFEQHELRVKRDDFEKFSDIVMSVGSRVHLDLEEFNRIVRLAYSMNTRGKQRKRPIEQSLLGSSETVREVPLNGSAVKIQSGPHGDMRSQAEMT